MERTREDEQHEHRERREEQPPPRSQRPSLLQLQRSAGNQAVSAMVARSRQPMLARYEAGEHAQVGGATDVTVNGVPMTQGEVNAMGDFFNSPTEMQGADPAELTTLRDLIRRDKDARTGKPGATPVETKEWEAATHGRYLKLAAQNRAHFAPPPGSPGVTGENHKVRWYELHRQALFQAWFDGRFNQHKVSNQARVGNSFAAHFLTDAFSAGHLINKPQITQFARDHFQAMKSTGLIFGENAFTKGVAQAVLAHPDAGKKLRAHELKLVTWGDVTEQRFSEFLWQFAKKDPDKFFNAFVRVLHDHLDDAIKVKGGGVEVTNKRGDTPWRLSGDATLAQSPTSLKTAQEAALLADKNLELAANATSEPDYVALSNQVWDLTPIPTKVGEQLIQDSITKIADAAQPEAVTAFAALAIAEIDAGIAELITAGHMQPKQGATAPNGAPLPEAVPAMP